VYPYLIRREYDPDDNSGGILGQASQVAFVELMADQKQAVQNAEVLRYDREEIHPGDALMVIF
jgi:hypothetical protein